MHTGIRHIPVITAVLGSLAMLSSHTARGDAPPARNLFKPLISTPFPTPRPGSHNLEDYRPEELRLTAIFTTLSGVRMASLENREGIGFPIKIGSEIGPDRVKVVEISAGAIQLEQSVGTSVVTTEIHLKPNL